MQARCPAPIHTLVGNWVHGLAARRATPGPNLDELHELVRFLDRRLRASPTASTTSPPIVWFERDYAPPEPFPASLPGRWRAASAVPAPVRPRARVVVQLAASCRWPARLDGGRRGRSSAGSTGSATGRRPARAAPLSWGAGGPPNGLARDLRPDEAPARPTRRRPLDGAARGPGRARGRPPPGGSTPGRHAVVRLTDVAPDGTSAQVSAGILNLTHRRSHDEPEPLEPGVIEEVRVPLRTAGYRFAAGHRIRVSVASSAWPVLWPSPLPASSSSTAVPRRRRGSSLPVVPPAGGPGDVPVPAFKTTPPDSADRSAARAGADVAGLADRRGRHRRHVTVTIHDGGEDVLDDGRRLYCGGDADVDRIRGRPGPGEPRGRRRLSLA